MCLFILRVRLHSPQSHKDTGKLYFRFQILLRGILRQPLSYPARCAAPYPLEWTDGPVRPNHMTHLR